MAEKITIAEIDIDYDRALKDTADLRKKSAELKASLKELKDEGKENTAEFVQYSTELKAVNEQVRKNEKQIINYTKAKGISCPSSNSRCIISKLISRTTK